MTDLPPILRMGSSGLYVISAFRGALIFLGTVTQECPPLLVVEFLHRVADIFEEYFGAPIDEELVKENFSTVVRRGGRWLFGRREGDGGRTDA